MKNKLSALLNQLNTGISIIAVITSAIAIVLAPNIISAGDFRSGVASVDITPPLGCAMSGYAAPGGRYSTGVMHPLHANAVVFSDSRSTAVIITLDLLNLNAPTVKAIRQRITASTGIPEDHIMLASSHTHAGPMVGKTFSEGGEPDPDPGYMRILEEKIAESALQAHKNMHPAVLEYGEGNSHLNVNRRLRVNDEMAMRPNLSGIVDHRVKILKFKPLQSDAPSCILFHFPCHPNVMRGDNTLISGDHPSPAKAYVETMFGNACIALYAQGCTGNIRPNFSSPDGGFAPGKKYDVEQFGKTLGKEVVRVCTQETTPVRNTAIQAKNIELILPAKKGGTINSEIQAIHIGDMWIVAIPGEPCIEFALQIEQKITGTVLVFGYSNDSIGYLCPESYYAEGGYEPTSSFATMESEKIILSTAVNLYQSMINR